MLPSDNIYRSYDNDGIRVHRVSGTMSDIHRDYGLWIFCWYRNSVVPASRQNHQVRRFEFYNISHFWGGEGYCSIENSPKYRLKHGECTVITPGTLNVYNGVDGSDFCEDSICFCGPVADHLCRAGVISNGIFDLGSSRKLLPIIDMARDPAADSQINANIALQQLLVDIYNQRRDKLHGDVFDPIDRLTGAIRNNPKHWWQVSELCRISALSEESLRQMFMARTGMLPKQYIESTKLHFAAELLRDGKLSLAEVAAAAGYRDHYHFSRRFSMLFGIAPGRYRREARGGGNQV